MIAFPQTNVQKQAAAIGFNVRIVGVWQLLTRTENGNLSLTARNYRTFSILFPANKSKATTSFGAERGINSSP
jgi:hypothetical protein